MNKLITLGLLLLIFIITIIGLPLDIMAPDAALYASIAKNMYVQNDFINLYSLGNDWLDKPHFPFWLSALSFKLFGFSNLAYKLPGVLLFFFGTFITFKFTKAHYNKETAILATLILCTSLHSVISNFDVRAEPFLTGLLIASIYYFYEYSRQHKIKHLVLGSLFCAFAIMTKGMFAIIPVAAALGGEFLMKQQWKRLFDPYWLLAIFFILIFITPELYTLYHQFDSHPEKVIFGKTKVSGIRFFFWDSQFGRFFNTGPIKGKGDIFFFIHTVLWAFLPWAIAFYIATFLKLKNIIKKSRARQEEYFSLFAVLSTFILFSLSKFQLAHYMNIVFPFMAIITANFIVKLQTNYKPFEKMFRGSQWFVISLVALSIPTLYYIQNPEINFYFILVLGIAFLLLYLVKTSTSLSTIKKLFYYSAVSYCVLYGYLLTHFYPTLLSYQGYTQAARYINKTIDDKTVYFINNKIGFDYELYTNTSYKSITLPNSDIKSGDLFLINKAKVALLTDELLSFEVLKEFDHFPITKINGNFLNRKTREQTLRKLLLVKIK